MVFNYTLRYSDARDQTISEELVPVFVSADGEVDVQKSVQALRLPVSATAGKGGAPDVGEIVAEIETLEALAQSAASEVAERGFQRVAAERTR